jgi:pyruvate carboxylase
MAQFMVSNNLTTQDILDKGESISFPASVQAFFKGDLGQPAGGFPKKLQKIVLKGVKPYTKRPNHHLAPIDFDTEYPTFVKRFQKGFTRDLMMTDFLSWKLYPKVWETAHDKHLLYDDVSTIPTKNFFYGLKEQEETVYEISPGKTIIVKLLSVGPPNADGIRILFFKVNGQTRNIEVADKTLAIEKVLNEKADAENPLHLGAPLQGLLSKVLVKPGQAVKKNDPIFVIEAMKMETTATAVTDGVVQNVALKEGTMVLADDLVVEMKA